MDEHAYANIVSRMLTESFGKTPKLATYRNHGKEVEYIVLTYSKKIILELEALGIHAGDKTANQVGIPNWILNDNEFLRTCIRGLVDTDGCVYKKFGWNTPQLEFYSQSKPLLNGVREGLLRLGIKASNITKGKRLVPKVGVYGKDAVLKYVREIGFTNPKYKARFNKIVSQYSTSCLGSVVV
jgi:intein/homing endonuclease